MRILWAVSLLAALAIGLFAGGAYELSKQELCLKSSARLEALTKANELQTAFITLSLLKQGKVHDVTFFFETQIKSSLVVLRAMKPGLDLSTEDMALINESIDKASRAGAASRIPPP